jgi:hypothetical protein
MHDLLRFAPRPRPIAPPTDPVKALVNALVNDIQIIASYDRAVILATLGQFAHDQRIRVLKEEQRDRLGSS